MNQPPSFDPSPGPWQQQPQGPNPQQQFPGQQHFPGQQQVPQFPGRQPAQKKGGCLKIGLIVAAALVVLGGINSCLHNEQNSSAPAPAGVSSSASTSRISPTAAATQASSAQAPSQTTQPPPTQAPPATQAPAKPPAPAVPAEHQAALNKAQSYSDLMHMSKRGLYDQLTSTYGEKFPADAAQYAVDNVKADWNKNALEKARSYQKTMNMSKEAIRDQLTSDYGEKFTAAQADYAVKHL